MSFGQRNVGLMVVAVCLTGALATGSAHALPALQLGPDNSDPNAIYDTTTQTWVTDISAGGEFHLEAFANATAADGGNGNYAWEAAAGTNRTAFLVLTAVPKDTMTDVFDLSVMDDSGLLTLVEEGFGQAPLADDNGLAPHGVFDSWYEIYQFNFDGSLGTIGNTQPGDTGTGQGYMESIWVTVNSAEDGLAGIHADLFTFSGDGAYTDVDNKFAVNSVAPYSHDFEAKVVPVPAAAWMGMLMLGGLGSIKKFRRRVA